MLEVKLSTSHIKSNHSIKENDKTIISRDRNNTYQNQKKKLIKRKETLQ